MSSSVTSKPAVWDGDADARRFLGVLFDEAGRVVELRALVHKRRTISGYFDNVDALVAAAAKLDGRVPTVYVLLNPPDPRLLARACNRVKDYADHTTSDAEVNARRWLLVDLDPSRPAGISSSDEEHAQSIEKARDVRDALRREGWPDPILADSGNGGHLLYRIDLPSKDGRLVERVLKAIAFRFDDEGVTVDQAVFNPARISKLYGTVAGKGDDLPGHGRPHRRARLLDVPAELRAVARGLLERVADAVPRAAPPGRSPAGGREPIDVEGFIARHGLEVARTGDWNGGRRWILSVCPWNPEHTDRSAYILQFSSGAVAAGCLHASCESKKWKDLRALLEPHNGAQKRGSPPTPFGDVAPPVGAGDGPVDTLVASDELRDLVPAVWVPMLRANDPPTLFVRGGQLVHIRFPPGGSPHLEPLTVDDAHGLVFRAGAWCRRMKDGALKPAHPPKDVARDLLSRPHEDLPRIEAVVSTPVFDDGWRLVATPGFHQTSGLYLHLDGLEVPAVSERPTADEVGAAVATLEDIVHDFPFVKPSDRAHAIAAFVLPFVRRAIRGPAPVHDIEAPVPGTGKSLLADLISRVATGEAIAAATMPQDEDEVRKKITAQLLASRPIVCFDNVTSLCFGTLAAAITADPWTDRLLGRSQELVLPNRTVWLVTANNPKLTTEIARRCVRIRIDPRLERPWERSGFRHADIRGYVEENRGRIVAAILTLALGWLAAGAPRGRARLGSFEHWSDVLGGILEFAGIPGFLDDRNELFERADAEGAEWRAFVTAWAERLPPGPKSSGELAAFCEREQLLDRVFATGRGQTQRGLATRLGMALAAREGRVFVGWRIVRMVDAHDHRALWQLSRDATAESSGGPAGPAGPVRDLADEGPALETQIVQGPAGDGGTCGTFFPSLTDVRACACARTCAGGTEKVPHVPQGTEDACGERCSEAGPDESTSRTTSRTSREATLFDGRAEAKVADREACPKAKQELIEERAAILEYEAGLARADSELEADSVIDPHFERTQ